MTISAEHDEWLKKAGYQYYAFISWPHIQNDNMKNCVKAIKTRIEQDLRLDIDDPHIFLDEQEIKPGYQWEPVLKDALCKSVTMIALCAPVYYSQKCHLWCGLEWATMETLKQKRLGDDKLHTILPILVKDHQPPKAVTSIQYSFSIDLRGVLATGYYESEEFKQVGLSIVDHVERVAWKLKEKNARADYDTFALPTGSPFEDFKDVPQPFPR